MILGTRGVCQAKVCSEKLDVRVNSGFVLKAPRQGL